MVKGCFYSLFPFRARRSLCPP